MRVLLVSKVELNPYVELLRRGLAAQGASTETRRLFGLVEACQGPRPAILHLHWPELQYAYPSSRTRTKRLASFLAGLLVARRAGTRLVWTLHNAEPHEGHLARTHDTVVRLLARLADAIHVHDETARLTLTALTGRHDRLYQAPHFSYHGWYPEPPSRNVARRALGLPETAYIVLSLGHLRHYKGNDLLLRGFAAVADPDMCLVVAGKPHLDDPHTAELTALAARDPRVRFLPRYIPDDEVPTFMAAADVVALPYRRSTTSGAALLAFTFGRPILAPALGPFPLLAAGGRGL
ncbi:MAG TPA: hypothetical protein DEP84_17835, partial [Chloroflexi bacterium]|nr:hypothetical protein [Chloroflexota bacterium]